MTRAKGGTPSPAWLRRLGRPVRDARRHREQLAEARRAWETEWTIERALDDLLQTRSTRVTQGLTVRSNDNERGLGKLTDVEAPLERNLMAYGPARAALSRMVSRQTGIYWGTSGHTTEPVAIGALALGTIATLSFGASHLAELRRTAVPAMQAVLQDLRALFREEQYSRMPVYRESLDNIVGVVFVKDLVALPPTATPALTTLMRSATFVPESKRVSELLKEMQRRQIQMAIVVDEYGGVSGMVTIEDVLEQIVGEIEDEYDFNEEEDNIVATGEFTCSLATYDLREQMNLSSASVADDVDEFALTGLAKAASRFVAAPRVAAAPAALECRLWKTVTLPNEAGAAEHTLVIGQVVGISIDDAFIDAQGRVNTAAMRPIARMGYMEYVTVTPEASFVMNRPSTSADKRSATVPAAARASSEAAKASYLS